MDPNDISHETIEALFYEQIRELTRRANVLDMFDYQFSDRWLQ